MTAEDLPARLAWHRRLSVRVGIGVLAILGLSLPVLLFWLDHDAEVENRINRQNHAERISTLISGALSERMLAGGGARVWHGVTTLAEQMRATGTALWVQILSRDGQVKVSTDPRLLEHRYRPDEPGCADCHGQGAAKPAFPVLVSTQDMDGRPIRRIFTPIEKQPACSQCHAETEAFRGMLAIDFDRTGEIAERRERIQQLLVVAAVSAVFIFLLIQWLLDRLINIPLTRLSAATGTLAIGRLDARVSVTGNDEIGLLGGRFNEMAARIEHQVGDLARGNQELDLLYRLMVELSASVSVGDVQSIVLQLLRDRLHPDYLAFAVETAEGEWDCAWVGEHGESGRLRGQGDLTDLIWLQDDKLNAAMPNLSTTAAKRALDEQCIVHQPESSGCNCVVPFMHNGRPIGLLYAGRTLASSTMDTQILTNLAAHVGLALSNARNFTHAITDGLTGLFNKRYGADRLTGLIYDARRYRFHLCLVMLDIDHFKRVNDTHGHQAGDTVLREVAQRLRSALRQSDLAIRYGGEEFMLLLPHTDQDNALAVTEELRLAIANVPFPLDTAGQTLAITVSLGVAQLAAEDTPDTLISRADQALYRAKRGGRNRVETAGASS